MKLPSRTFGGWAPLCILCGEKLMSFMVIEALRCLYAEDSVARTILDYFAGRERHTRATYVKHLLRAIRTFQQEVVSRKDVIAVLKKLGGLGLGRYVQGNDAARLEWTDSISLVRVGRIATGELDELESEADDLGGADVDEDNTLEGEVEMLEHRFPLREGLYVDLDLPSDFTRSEAIRMSKYLESLALA